MKESHCHNSKEQKGWQHPDVLPRLLEQRCAHVPVLHTPIVDKYMYFKEEAALQEVRAVKVRVRDMKVGSTSTEHLISSCASFCILNYCFFLLGRDSDLSLLTACMKNQSSYSAAALLWPGFPQAQWFSSIDFTAAMFSLSGRGSTSALWLFDLKYFQNERYCPDLFQGGSNEHLLL